MQTVENCTTISIGGGEVAGCTDMDACNYDCADATSDDGDAVEYCNAKIIDCAGNCRS